MYNKVLCRYYEDNPEIHYSKIMFVSRKGKNDPIAL